MARLRQVGVAVGLVLILASLWIAPLKGAQWSKDAAKSGTATAISSAQAASNSKTAKDEATKAQQAVDYILSVQRSAASQAAITHWYVQLFISLCQHTPGCHVPPIPKGLK